MDVMYNNVRYTCRYCKNECVKSGNRNGIQQFRCKSCRKYQKEKYIYSGSTLDNNRVISLVCKSMGIRDMAKELGVCTKTIIMRIKKIAKDLKPSQKYLFLVLIFFE